MLICAGTRDTCILGKQLLWFEYIRGGDCMLLQDARGWLKAPHHICCWFLMLMKDHTGCDLWRIWTARIITLDATKGYLLVGIPLEEGKALLRAPMIWSITLVELENFRVEDAVFVGVKLEGLLGRDCWHDLRGLLKELLGGFGLELRGFLHVAGLVWNRSWRFWEIWLAGPCSLVNRGLKQVLMAQVWTHKRSSWGLFFRVKCLCLQSSSTWLISCIDSRVIRL